ncbi:MAG: c-type cytochrome, partial [Anaerolineales bacterium]|nr:c-type cytochrome [Anaerolineales bacterium]
MKLRHIIILAISAILLAACNFTLAADVTPPPGYVAPPPAPTLGPLYPASAPDIENGAAIYVEKCMPCHGNTGLGDGPDGKQLPVKVAAFALPETAHKASPAQWFTTVTQGNLDRFMPPFFSLSDQERWDVISYALTLHTTPQQIETGKSLFEENCADCAKFFSNQEMMSALSANEIVKLIKDGTGDLPAFGSNLSDDEAYAVAAYIRTLTFTPLSAPLADSVTETPASPEATPLEGTAQAQPALSAVAGVTPEATGEPIVSSVGRVSGVIENRTGADLPSDLKITLRGYDHGIDPSAGPQEIVTLEATVNADGTYLFETELVESQIYLTEFEVGGLSYQSEYAVVPAETAELILPTIVVHATTEDFSALRIDSVQIFFDFANAD